MNRKVLIKGFIKIFIPLAVGSIAAMIVGTLVGTALGLGTHHTFFYIVVPIMAGGVGEGAIPLSVGYAEILHQDQGELFATILPPGDAGKPHRDPVLGDAELRGQALSAADRRGPPAAGRSTTRWIRSRRKSPGTWTSRTSRPPASPPSRSTCWASCASGCSACRRRWRCSSSPSSSSSRRRCRRNCSRARSSSTSSSPRR